MKLHTKFQNLLSVSSVREAINYFMDNNLIYFLNCDEDEDVFLVLFTDKSGFVYSKSYNVRMVFDKLDDLVANIMYSKDNNFLSIKPKLLSIIQKHAPNSFGDLKDMLKLFTKQK